MALNSATKLSGRTRPFLTLLLVGVLAQAGLQGQAPAPGALAEDFFPQLRPILVNALKQSPQMLLRNIDIAQAEANRYQARSVLLPGLSASISYSINESAVSQGTSVTSKNDGLFYSVGVNQPVFAWGTLKAQSDSAKIGVKIAEKNYAEAYRTLVLSLRAQFLALISKKMAARNAQFALQVARSALKVAEEKLRTGQASPGEVIPLRVAVEETELNLDKAQADLAQTRRFFTRMAGIDELPESEIPPALSLDASHYDASRSRGLLAAFDGQGGVENTPQALSYRYYIEQAELSYKVARFRLYPRIGMSAGFSQVNSTNVSGNIVTQAGVTSQSASLTASWSIFDGWATKGAKLSALATKRSYERQLLSYVTATAAQVRDVETQIGFASRALRIVDTRWDIIRGLAKNAAEGLARGAGSQAEVDTATQTMNNYELVVLTQRAEYLNRWAEFRSLTGQDPALSNLPPSYLTHAK